MKIKVLKPVNVKYVTEGQEIDLPDHIAEAGIKKGIFADASKKAPAKRKPRKAKK